MAEPVQLNGKEILFLLSDRILVAGEKDEVEQIFQKSGLTIYIERGASSQGSWFVKDGKYCSIWPPSKYAACYDVTQDGDEVTFISKTGERFAMRIRSKPL